MLKGGTVTPKTRDRISRGLARYRRRQKILATVGPRDLTRLEQSGTVTPALRPLLKIAGEESADLIDALGGPDQVTPQQRALVEDLAAAGIVLRATLMQYVQGAEGSHAQRIGTLVSVRRASLMALGLDRVANEVQDLSAYMASKDAQNARKPHSDANANTSDAEVVEPESATSATSGSGTTDSRSPASIGRDDGSGGGSGSSAGSTPSAAHAPEGDDPC